jgi:hypothetical protein
MDYFFLLLMLESQLKIKKKEFHFVLCYYYHNKYDNYTEEILGNQLKIKKELLFLKVSSFSSIELYYYYYQSMSLKVVREKIYLLFSQYCGKTNREREKRSNLSKQTAVCPLC